MPNISLPLLTLLIGLTLLIVLMSRVMRIIAAIVALIVIVYAAKGVFIRGKACPNDGAVCIVELQPTYAGPCSSTDGAALLTINRKYVLTAQAGVKAEASCIDWRFWQ